MKTKRHALLYGLCVSMLTGCINHVATDFSVSFKNMCDQPVYISVTEISEEGSHDNFLLDVGKKNVVRSCITLQENPKYIIPHCVPDSYILQITANDKQRILDGEQLLLAIQTAEYHKRGGGGILMWRTDITHEWTIADPSLCP